MVFKRKKKEEVEPELIVPDDEVLIKLPPGYQPFIITERETLVLVKFLREEWFTVEQNTELRKLLEDLEKFAVEMFIDSCKCCGGYHNNG